MNLPNALTMLRFALVPVFAWLYANGHPLEALAVYVAAALTDALDGYLARRLNQVTSLGKLLDPAADKPMQLTMLCLLFSSGHVPLWVVVVLGVKELYLAVGSMVLFKRKVVIQANILGKAATLSGILAFLCLFPWHEIHAVSTAGHLLLMVSLVLAICSVVSYSLCASRALKQGTQAE